MKGDEDVVVGVDPESHLYVFVPETRVPAAEQVLLLVPQVVPPFAVQPAAQL